MNRQSFFAVRVVVRFADTGETSERDYVRGEQRMSRERFAAWALGDMLWLVAADGRRSLTFDVHEIDFHTVRENRQYQHTTH